MLQFPGPGKRRAEPAAAVKFEVGECFGDDGNSRLPKRVKPAAATDRQDVSYDVLDEPSPLGLRLKKSPSLLDLIQMKLSQAKPATGLLATSNNISEIAKKKEVTSGTLTSGERLKASNFPANALKIGTWEYISRYEGDLVAKCYFAKHKLVWEVLDDGLKSKIEIQWSDIIALKVTCLENDQGSLDLVLARPPLFFKETDPQPRKHTLWQAASDFTNGQASLNRRHTLHCPSNLLNKNFEKLIQCDQRLNELSQQKDIMLETPGFEPRHSIFENPNESKDCPVLNLKYERETSLPKFIEQVSPCASSSPSKKVEQPEFHINIGSWPADLQTNGVAQEPKNPVWQNQLKVTGLRASMSIDDLVNHLGNCIAEQRTVGNHPLANDEGQSKVDLEDLAQYLLSDTQGLPASDDKYLMARVNSLYSLLDKDAAPFAVPKPSIVEVDSDDSDEELYSTPASKAAGHMEPRAISRKDSFGDLMLNLPRISSVPQFLFDIPEDFDK